MPRRPPVGFVLLGLAMAALGTAFAASVISSGDAGWVSRLLVGGVAALFLLAAVALRLMRPWLVRAIDAWALACPVAVIASIAAGNSLGDLFLLVMTAVAVVGAPCAVVRWYVRGHAAVAGLLPPPPRVAP